MKPPVIDHDRRQAVRSVALRMLSEKRESPTQADVTAMTLQALYRTHPHVALEDVLELRVLLDGSVTRGATMAEQVDDVLASVFTELTAWNTASTVSI